MNDGQFLYDALSNLLEWVRVNLFAPIKNSLTNNPFLNNFFKTINDLINAILKLFNNQNSNIEILNPENIASVISILIIIICLCFIITTIKVIISNIMSWISGDTIVLTDIHKRRKNKKASKH